MSKESDRLERLKLIVSSLEEKPGCYQYLDAEGVIIYVGKAKNLKRRVSSYFNKNQQSHKTRILVSKIEDIKYIYVNSDEDALLQENQLIKRYKPKYNILLKDDKTYPSVCISNEYFPRIYKTRKIIKRAGKYYGPFSHQGTLNNMLDLINHLYPVRRCRFNITEEGIQQQKYNTCLEYHIKNCKAPCVGKQSHEDYMNDIREIAEILSGNTRGICDKLMQQMQQLASEMRFEEAQIVKYRYDKAREFCEKSEVVSFSYNNIDVFSIVNDEGVAYINYLHVANGGINQAFTFEYKKKIEESDEDLLALGIIETRERFKSTAKEIIVPFEMEEELEGVSFTVPQRGDKRKLLDLSLMNVRQYKLDKMKQAEKLNPEQRSVNLMRELQDKLKLPKLPMHIECFDNSNVQGTDAVAGCVVFKKTKPARSEYRRYNIKSVVGPDDYGSMSEVVFRRYYRAVEENTPLPDLIITDGGKGQMEVVRKVIEEELHLNIPIAGLAKDAHHRTSELLYGNPPVIIGLDIKSALFNFLTRIQDEVHRYAITFHREKRSKHQVASALDEIKGIGPATKRTLLKKYKSIKRIKEADITDLEATIGKSKAKIIKDAL
ncbi:MAG: excinuclease ABC subunit UvrC [Bacteroidaceae bacterium]|nr:excinuclease ABC subunit UvrC [Bacteroidaceae bacterium]